eukprot:superscaffoldBa00006903_g22013
MCAAALEEYCGSIFWNASYLNREDPDLPLCVEQTVLVWIPLGFLWLCAPWHLVALCWMTHMNTKHLSKLYFIKQILLLLCQEGVRRREGAVDSATLFLFWLLLVLCDIFPFQTLLREALRLGEIDDVPRFCLFYISFGLELIALILSALADISPEDEELVKKNPEMGAAFLSRITFNWFNSMVVKGYKRPLVQEDMWELNEADSTGYISQRFQYFMESNLGAARTRFQNKKNCEKAQEEAFQNGFSSGLRKGTFKGILIESAFFKLLQDLLAFVSPQLLK